MPKAGDAEHDDDEDSAESRRPGAARDTAPAAAPRPRPRYASPALGHGPAAAARAGRARRSPVTPASGSAAARLVPALGDRAACSCSPSSRCSSRASSAAAAARSRPRPIRRAARRPRAFVAVRAHTRLHQGGRAQRHHDPRPGLAQKDTLAKAGFSDRDGQQHDQQRANSSVLYGTRAGARTQARTVARALDIATVQRMDADTRDLSEGADVVVILGQEKAP